MTGIDDAIARLDGLEARIKLYITVELERFGRIVTAEMVETHTFQNITGRLERSIGYSVEEWRSGFTVLNVFATAPYAQAVEEGTATSQPYPFFWPVFWKHYPELQARLQKAIDEAFAEAGVAR